MTDLNSVTIIGRLVRDPELKYTQSGSAVCNFGIAVNKSYSTSDGEKKEEVSFFDCTAWAKTGEIIAEHLQKGRRIAIQGSCTNRDGRTRTEIKGRMLE